MPKPDAESIRQDIERFLVNTHVARTVSEKCRDYKDGNQWTDQEIEKLKSRSQAPIVVNRVKPKIEGLLGLYNIRKSDPKAYARTQAHEESSHVVTDALRFVADNTDFDSTRIDVADDFFVEGYGGAIMDVKQKKNGEVEIRMERIPWDRIYFDPHSRKNDFKDSRYMGIILWMDEDEAQEKFPKVNINTLISSFESYETFEDRPFWVDSNNRRIRIALHFSVYKDEWWMSILSGNTFIVDPQISPFLDDDGEPANPIELVSANVARDNARYGEAQSFLDPQDEINHRRSKYLHMLNSRQTFGRKGAIGDDEDIKKFKRELQKPDGHIEFRGDKFGDDFGIMPPSTDAQGQFELYLDSKAELDAVSLNAQLSGERQSGDLSGVAIGKLQQAGTMELNRQYALLANWERRCYKQDWGRIKQFWTEEKWIRVTDDQDNLRWVGFNTQITVQQALEEKINDEAEQPHVRRLAANEYTQMVNAEDPRLQELVEVRNNVPELDVDIILDQSFDSINVQEEQFRLLAQFANGTDIDLVDLIDISQLRGKDELIEKIEKRRAERAQAQDGAIQMEAQKSAAQTENTQASTVKTIVEAEQTQIETELLKLNPDPNPQAII